MRRPLHLVLAVSVVALGLVAASRDAHAQEENDTPAMLANRGPRLALGPVLLLPSRSGGPLGGGLDAEGRYGLKAGPTVLAPGVRLAAYFLSSRVIGTARPTFRVTIPIGPLAPFLVGGLGGGWISNPAENGLAVMGGGGLMVHVGRVLAIGAEITYQEIRGTELGNLAIGPAIAFGG